jgi:hypothetical protein
MLRSVVAIAVLGLGALPALADPTLINIDPPNATQAIPRAINAKGDVAGNFNDASGVNLGFIRTAAGKYKIFDLPSTSSATTVLQIDDKDTVAGEFTDSQGNVHGYTRTSKGKVTQIDAPSADRTYLFGLNNKGQTTGFGYTATEIYHGWVANKKGTALTFDVPNGTNWTVGQAINDSGVIFGMYMDASSAKHLFLRDSKGNVTPFDIHDSNNPQPIALTSNGIAMGTIAVGSVNKGFVRQPDGTVDVFFVDGADSSTNPLGVNASGTTTGYYNARHAIGAFIRTLNGTVTEFRYPGADGTFPQAIGDSGVVVGYYTHDSQAHGFMATP